MSSSTLIDVYHAGKLFDAGWNDGRLQYLADHGVGDHGPANQHAWETYSRNVVPALRESAKGPWKNGYEHGYAYQASLTRRAPTIEPPRRSLSPPSSASAPSPTPSMSDDSSPEPESSSEPLSAPPKSDDVNKTPQKTLVRKNKDPWSLKGDYIVIKWNDRFGAYKRYAPKIPVVQYIAGINGEGGRQYKAAKGVDARILCPVPECKHTFEGLQLLERHIDSCKFSEERAHTYFAESKEYVDTRMFPPLKPPPPCRLCGWTSSTGRPDTLRRHEASVHGRPIGDKEWDPLAGTNSANNTGAQG